MKGRRNEQRRHVLPRLELLEIAPSCPESHTECLTSRRSMNICTSTSKMPKTSKNPSEFSPSLSKTDQSSQELPTKFPEKGPTRLDSASTRRQSQRKISRISPKHKSSRPWWNLGADSSQRKPGRNRNRSVRNWCVD